MGTDFNMRSELLGTDERSSRSKLISYLTTAISNFSVQYNFQAISIALIVMSASVCTSTSADCRDGDQSEWVKSTATGTIFAGAIFGQLTMGYAGDVLGRDKAMLLTLSLASLGALFSAFAFGSAETIYGLIIACRFLLGFGLGGVYPLSATKAAEDGGHGGSVDVTAAAWSFVWQSPGSMGPWLLAYFFSFSSMSDSLKWRLILGLGCVPGLIVTIASYQDTPKKIESSSAQDTESIDIFSYLRQWKYLKKLAVTGGGWFLYDICYYGVNLFGGEIVSEIWPDDDDNVSADSAIQRTTSRELIALAMGVPACIITTLLLKRCGVKNLQVWGFVLIAAMFILLASLFAVLEDKSPDGLYTIYVLLLFSLSFGPNVTTFVLPAQMYPKKIRATFNGMSAAMGKFGAVVGVYLFGSVAEVCSYEVIMIICAVFAVAGAVVSYLWIEEDDDSERNDFKEDFTSSHAFLS